MLNKKGVSEVISVTLLIVIVVILASLFFAWSRNSAKTKMDEVSAELKQVNDKDCSNAQFYVDSCTIYSTTKKVRLVLMNNSDIKLFNLNLIINGEVSGSFEEIVEAGETVYLSTDTNFNFTRGDQSTLNSMDIDSIDNITLTNGACPKEVIDVSGCTIVSTFWPPTANVGSGTYYLEQEVTLSAEDGATIYYTLDGNTPTTDSNVYSTPITIPEDANTTLKAIASAESSLASDVNTWVYNITHTLDAPTADPVAGTYYGTTDVTLSAEEGADIYYRLNSGRNTLYTTPIMLPSLNGIIQKITATAQKAGYGTSSQFSGNYTIYDSNDSTIYIFNLKGTGYDINGTIDNDANTITAELPAGTDLRKLNGSINLHRDAIISPDVSVISDYSNPVKFRVTAGDWSLRIYTVTVTLETAGNSIVYDTPTKVLTITLDPDISLETSAKFIVYDNEDKDFITTYLTETTAIMDSEKPSPYDLDGSTLTTIGFDTALFLENYGSAKISHFDVVDGKSNLLATIPVADITVNSK